MTDLAQSSRHLAWEACYNARDLGGLPTTDGQLTRPGAIVRTDMLARLTPTGCQALLDYGVRTVIDLRSPPEAAKEPDPLISGTGVTLTSLNLPLEAYTPHVSALIRQAQSRGEVYCIILDHYPTNMATVMQAIAEASPGGVLIHCHAGKDRTGMVAALLLSLAEVLPDEIAADYAQSQDRLWPLWEQIVAQAGGEENADIWLKPTATAEMMHHMLDHIHGRYGGVHNYLLHAGLTETEIAQLRQRLRA